MANIILEYAIKGHYLTEVQWLPLFISMHQGSILSYFLAKHAISVKPLDLFTGQHRQLGMHVYFIIKELATSFVHSQLVT